MKDVRLSQYMKDRHMRMSARERENLTPEKFHAMLTEELRAAHNAWIVDLSQKILAWYTQRRELDLLLTIAADGWEGKLGEYDEMPLGSGGSAYFLANEAFLKLEHEDNAPIANLPTIEEVEEFLNIAEELSQPSFLDEGFGGLPWE